MKCNDCIFNKIYVTARDEYPACTPIAICSKGYWEYSPEDIDTGKWNSCTDYKNRNQMENDSFITLGQEVLKFIAEEPTTNLRFIKRKEYESDKYENITGFRAFKILQQQFKISHFESHICISCDFEWRDIPIVEE